MTAEDIAKVLGGRRAGASWMARCPPHNDREPSLSIRQAEDGTGLVRCHAGCEQARVITALRSLAANGYGLHDVEIRLNNQNRRFGRAA
jgi:hypothetical protein